MIAWVGPIAELIKPRDNDADGIDVDPNETYVDLASGVLDDKYGGATGYEVAGLIWLQGWNEMFNTNANTD